MPVTKIDPGFLQAVTLQHFAASQFPVHKPQPWFTVHLATGGWSPLHIVSGLYTAHMTTFAARHGVSWHTHRNEETYTWMLDGVLRHADTTGGSGELRPGDFQRMFAGSGIEHEEMSASEEPARFIQIVFLPGPEYNHVAPHYQQLNRSELPVRQVGGAQVRDLIGGASPMNAHCQGRLLAIDVEPRGTTELELPAADEDMLMYVTDGEGIISTQGRAIAVQQYDVVIARSDVLATTLAAPSDAPLRALNFFLPTFVPRGNA